MAIWWRFSQHLVDEYTIYNAGVQGLRGVFLSSYIKSPDLLVYGISDLGIIVMKDGCVRICNFFGSEVLVIVIFLKVVVFEPYI